MTGNELIKKLEQLPEEERNLQVKFFNPKYENYETVNRVSSSNYGSKFVLLNEA